MMVKSTKKQSLRKRIEMEMLDDTRTEFGPGYDPERYENWSNYQEYLEAKRREEYDRALAADYEASEMDPDLYYLLIR